MPALDPQTGSARASLERFGLADPALDEPRLHRLVALLESLDRCAVAYSGGVDSTLLLRLSTAVLGDRAVGVLAVSESLDQSELESARRTAERMRVPLAIVTTREYDNPEYRRNDANRCYHCKTELFTVVKRFAQERGIPWVLDGSNADDAGDFRPGLRARDEQGVRSPLLEVGLDKAAIRRFSQALGLPTWDKPAAPCLASRLPYGTEVTDERLRQVEAAEMSLRALGFRVCRVRHHGQVGRIEVPAEDLPRLLEPGTREKAVAGVKGAGFLHAAVDLEGFRSGSLNAALDSHARAQALGVVPVSEVGRLSAGG